MSKYKRINVYFDAFPLCSERPSGIGHLLLETLRSLEKSESFTRLYNIVLIVPRDKYRQIDKWKFKNITVKRTPIMGKIWSALVLYRLLPPADVFFGKGVYVFANYTTWPLMFSRSITYIHDLNYVRFPETVTPKVLNVLTRNIPRWIRMTDRIATISEFSKGEIVEYYSVDAKKISVIYCGVDRNIFYRRSRSEVKVAKAKYNISNDYILFLSNIEPRKNVLRLLEAYSELADHQKECTSLVLVGADGWLNDDIKQKVDQVNLHGGKVIWPSKYVPDEDLPALLSGAKFLIHPALYEGFGISPLQAMACGTLPIVSLSSSLPEVVGTAGVYVDPQSIGDIRKAMSVQLKKSGLDIASEREMLEQADAFTWEKSAGRLKLLIDDLVK